MSNIRVTYSGLISLAVGISSVLTGTVFTLIVTRRLTPEEFGTWGLIGSLIVYVLVIEPIISFWTTRETARGINSARTAVFTSGIFSTGAIVAYIIIAYFTGLQSDADQKVLFFAAILVPFMFLNKTLTAINLGWKPQGTSYGILVFELVKIPSALAFVYFLDMGVEGAIIATTIAYAASIVILAIYAKDKIKERIQILFLKNWLKRSWLPMYPGIGTVIFSLDVLLFTLITGSVVGLAFYSAALAISSFVAQSGLISQAIYPKLLEGGKKSHLQENLLQFFYFGFPLAALSLILAKPGLFALNPLYAIAVPVVIIMTLRTFLYKLVGIFEQALQGIEQVDFTENPTFKSFIKSKLFWIPSVRLIKFSLYITSLVVVLILLTPHYSIIELVIYWSIISLGIEIPFLVYLYILTKKNFVLKLPFVIIIKYLLTSIGTFGITYLLMEEFLVYKNRIFEFLPNVLVFIAFGTGAYLIITYLIDQRTRKLFNAIIKELRKKSDR